MWGAREQGDKRERERGGREKEERREGLKVCLQILY